MQLVWPEVLKVSTGQGTQTLGEVLPLYGLYVRAGHAMHADNEVPPFNVL